MSDYNSQGYNYYSNIVSVGDDDYLFQGSTGDDLIMFRPVDKLLECERDNIQSLMDGEKL